MTVNKLKEKKEIIIRISFYPKSKLIKISSKINEKLNKSKMDINNLIDQN